MQFLIYIHCHVVIILPLRCYSSYKRHRLYNQPAEIYLKSSLVIRVLTYLARSRNAGNLLEEICTRYSLQKVQRQRGILLLTGVQERLQRFGPSEFPYAV